MKCRNVGHNICRKTGRASLFSGLSELSTFPTKLARALLASLCLVFFIGTPAAFAQALTNVSLSPTSVVGGTSSTGTVTVSPAPSSNISVTLTSSNTAVATVPATVTVLSGATTANFTVTTYAVTANASPVITAAYNSVQKTATLTVTPAALSSLALSPNPLTGGNACTGTVTLTGQAPPSGVNVTLTSSNTSAATVPSNVMVAAGATTATFAVTTQPVSSQATSVITAMYSGVSKPITLTIMPPRPLAPSSFHRPPSQAVIALPARSH